MINEIGMIVILLFAIIIISGAVAQYVINQNSLTESQCKGYVKSIMGELHQKPRGKQEYPGWTVSERYKFSAYPLRNLFHVILSQICHLVEKILTGKGMIKCPQEPQIGLFEPFVHPVLTHGLLTSSHDECKKILTRSQYIGFPEFGNNGIDNIREPEFFVDCKNRRCFSEGVRFKGYIIQIPCALEFLVELFCRSCKLFPYPLGNAVYSFVFGEVPILVFAYFFPVKEYHEGDISTIHIKCLYR